MAMCKHCGMDSSDAVTCEWCKRPLAPQSAASEEAGQSPPPRFATTVDRIEEDEEARRKERTTFLIVQSILIVIAASLLIWKPQIFVPVTIASAFAAGIMLTRWRVIEPYSEDWILMLVLLALTVAVPAPFFVLLGYAIYGYIFRNLDANALWLYGTFAVLMLVLEVVGILAWRDGVPVSAVGKYYSTQVLSFLAIAFGWMLSSLSPR